ncbi:MAG: squalene/phytoene synthase family protein, partial [Gemmatimonadetes bacterium]|nr:squalene/phytoene synthase family protein [Gemmatimonadota bacterium]
HEVYEGEPAAVGDRALQHAVRSFGIRREDFLSVLSGVERDLTTGRYETFGQLRAYCFDVASSVGLLCLPIFGRDDAPARDRAIDLGLGMQLVNVLRDVREDALRDRVYLPQEDLRRFGVEPGELGRGVPNTALDSLVRFEAERARTLLRSGRELLPLLEGRNRFCPAALVGIYGDLLEKIERAGGEVVQRRVSLTGRRKAWLALRAAASRWDVMHR